MLKKVELQNFRKHTDLKVCFTEGLNVIRAPNEGGKTTTLEAIAYALFGSKVLRDGLDNTVTWGQPTNSLKVTVEYGDYVITRSKKGAEVLSMGQVFVTGQSEVTAFCEKLIGADGATAANLMFSNQMGLRGILTSGPKATSQLIEDLGEFSLFDKLLDAAQHRLALGSGAALEARVSQLTTELEQMPEVAAPDVSAHEAAQKEGSLQLALIKANVDKVKEDVEAVSSQIHAEERQRVQASKLAHRVTTLRQQLEGVQADIAAVPVPGEVEDTTKLEAMVAGELQFAARLQAYQKFLALPQPARWDRAKVDDEIRRHQADIKHADETMRQAQTNIKVAQAKLINSSTCGYCGQDVSQFPEVAKLNAELGAAIQAEQLRSETATGGKALAELHLEGVKRIFRAEDEVIRGVRGIEQYLERDESVVPVQYIWVGPVPQEGDRPDYAAQLAEVRARNVATVQARAKLETLQKQEAQLSAQVADASEDHSKVKLMPDVVFDALAIDLAALHKSEAGLSKQLYEVQQSVRDEAHAFEMAMEKFRNAQQRRVKVATDLDNARQEISKLEFNNGLVKKIRAARPVIGNKLWSMVLASVSTVFSQMRGENSIVSKEKDGFTVNGRSVDSLSGSTTDLLGLAVRCALTKTFVPGCQLIVLDEPSASCDASREAAMLGYIAASGFSQVLLVTHSDVSESFANNLITL